MTVNKIVPIATANFFILLPLISNNHTDAKHSNAAANQSVRNRRLGAPKSLIGTTEVFRVWMRAIAERIHET
ncbi:MAG: hypothetical protein EBT07_11620 [Actinobacteria bacterium]|nr:hypothetical protein [Actinomycetota bacterium]